MPTSKLTTIVAFSDSHGTPIPSRLQGVAGESTYVFFLGDGANSLRDMPLHKGFVGVSGNCDQPVLKKEEIVEVGNLKILLTHGDKYGVKRDLTSLYYRAQELGCTLAFYGHTHFADVTQYGGITFVCPGAIAPSPLGKPSYAYVCIYQDKITTKIVELD